jgi:hypothetical protein
VTLDQGQQWLFQPVLMCEQRPRRFACLGRQRGWRSVEHKLDCEGELLVSASISAKQSKRFRPLAYLKSHADRFCCALAMPEGRSSTSMSHKSSCRLSASRFVAAFPPRYGIIDPRPRMPPRPLPPRPRVFVAPTSTRRSRTISWPHWPTLRPTSSRNV